MGGVLLVPSVLAVAAMAAGVVGYSDASLWQHVLMLGGLILLMGARYRHFASVPPAVRSQDGGTPHRSWKRWWPTALGIAFAVFSLVTDDPADSAEILVTLVIPTAAYATIAATGRSRWSWQILGLLVVAYLSAGAWGDAAFPSWVRSQLPPCWLVPCCCDGVAHLARCVGRPPPRSRSCHLPGLRNWPHPTWLA